MDESRQIRQPDRQLGVTLIVLRLLVPADYGLMAIVSMIITVLASVAELGLGASLIQARKLSGEDLGAVTGAVIVLNLAWASWWRWWLRSPHGSTASRASPC